MTLHPESFAKSLADNTRLRLLILLGSKQELCVCELTSALGLPQPKVSRHLAILRETGILSDHKRGTWVFYRIHPALPNWARQVLAALAEGCEGQPPFDHDRCRLSEMADNPVVACN